MDTSRSTIPTAIAGSATEEPDVDNAVEQLVHSHLALARRIAHRYAGRGVDTDDLCQVAALGLIKAAQRFDPTRGDPFVAYAIPTITGELRRHFRDHGWWIRPPRPVQELRPALAQTEDQLHQLLSRTPTDAEVATDAGVAVAAVKEARVIATCFRPGSIDAPVGIGGQSYASGLDGHDRQVAQADARMAVDALLRELSQADREILRLRFAEDWTQARIAEHLGVSQMQMSRRIKGILDRLRSRLEDASGESGREFALSDASGF